MRSTGLLGAQEHRNLRYLKGSQIRAKLCPDFKKQRSFRMWVFPEPSLLSESLRKAIASTCATFVTGFEQQVS